MRYVFVFAFLFLFIIDASAQTLPEAPRDPRNPLPDFVYRNDEKRRELERNIERGDAAIPSTPIDLRSGREARRRQNIADEERKRIDALVEPNPEDSSRFSEFLKQKKTGITRLFPELNCQNRVIIYAEGECAGAVPNGSQYSFRLEDYTIAPEWSDLRLDGKSIFADGFLTQAILVSLGDAPIETISEMAEGFAFLNNFAPAQTLSGARAQSAELAREIESSGYKYANFAAVKLNETYALRAIAYKSDAKVESKHVNGKLSWNGDPRFINLKLDTRRDITVAFRVIRIEENGGITIVWKELSRRDAPKLQIAKRERPTDIR
ncbi:MAG: hypothetical protein KIS76_12290 [Pyrinomonadaceae bacterium]|nr:hypothetical protein [Pyrinomonadaceae bacterium]